MKISKLTFLTIAAGVILLSSCNNDGLNVTEEQQNLVAAPTFSGTIGLFVDVNTPGIRAGVIEDNADYADGEKFYWHNNDKVKVLFFKDGNLDSEPSTLIYNAVVPDGAKPNSCEFITDGSIAPGDYTAYALYPADKWSKDENGYKATSAWYSMQSDASSSAHLKDYMFMKAKAEDIEIGEESSGAINLRFKHLSSVVRLHIIENKESPTEGYLSGFTMETRDFTGLIHPSPFNTFPFFPVEAYLEGIDDDSLTPIESSRQTSLYVFGNLSFVNKGTHREVDFFMPVLPTGAPSDLANHRLTFETHIETQTETGTNSSQDRLGTYFGLSFNDQLSFMPNGFEAGKSYYFNLKTSAY